MEAAKKFIPIGAVAFGGAALAGIVTSKQSLGVQVAVGILIGAAIMYGAARFGVVNVGGAPAITAG